MEFPQVQYHSALESYMRIRNARKQAESYELQRQAYEQEMSQRAEQMRQQGIEFEQAQQDRVAGQQQAQEEAFNARKAELGSAIQNGAWQVMGQYEDVWQSLGMGVPVSEPPPPEQMDQVMAIGNWLNPGGVKKPIEVSEGEKVISQTGELIFSNPRVQKPGAPVAVADETSPTGRRYADPAQAIGQPAPASSGSIGPLVKIPDKNSPTGFRYGTREEALGQPAPQGGQQIEVGPDGTIRVKSGDFSVGSQTQATERLQPLTDAYVQIAEVNQLINQPGLLERTLTIPGRAETVFDIGREKLGMELNAEDQKALDSAQDFFSRSTKIYSDYLFGRGGKNLTKVEKQTVQGMLPKAGETWMDMGFSSTTQFKRQMKNLQEYVEIAMVRDYAILNNSLLQGANPEKVEQLLPNNSDSYKKLRGEMFRDMGVPNPTDPRQMSTEELRIEVARRKAERASQ